MPGSPAMLTGSVQASERYIATGSARRAPERERDRRRGRRDERVEALRPEGVEVALDQRADLLRLEVVGVVVAGRERVGPEHDPALRPRRRSPGRGSRGRSPSTSPSPQPRPVADAVVAGQVRGRLGRGDDVVRGEAVVGVRQADLLDDRARRPRARRPPRGCAPRRRAPCPATKYSLGRPRRLPRSEAAASSSLWARVSSVVGDGFGRRGRVALVASGDRVQQGRRVADVAGERPDLVERAREGHDPVAADPAVGRLHPDDPAQGGRLADRAAGVGPDRERRVERGHGRGRAAAAAAGHPVECPRVGGRAVRGVLGRGAHRELVHVRLAEDDRARVPQALGDVGVVRARGSPRGCASRRCTGRPRPTRGP